MMSITVDAIVLAAGRSTRFGTGTTKQLADICGAPMVSYPLRSLRSCGYRTTVVVGAGADHLTNIISKFDNDIHIVRQEEQRGTGHAVQCAYSSLQHEYVVIMNGDMPLVTSKMIEAIVQRHIAGAYTMTVCTTRYSDPTGYGRIVIDKSGVLQIIEEKECSDEQRSITHVNAGIYVVSKAFLGESLGALSVSSRTGEVYLTDLVKIAGSLGKRLGVHEVESELVQGVNTLTELYAAQCVLQQRICQSFMERGVRFIDPRSVVVDALVSIGPGSVIGRGVHIQGDSEIGSRVSLEAYSILNSVTIHDDVVIKSHSVLEKAVVQKAATVGPFARLRKGSLICQNAQVGNFVETKNATLGERSKAKHLSYLGDTVVGVGSNIGAGVITCNYDGQKKHRTTIGDHVMVGANANLVAPIEVASESTVAAGSTLTKPVPKNALAIARARQDNKLNWKQRWQKKVLGSQREA